MWFESFEEREGEDSEQHHYSGPRQVCPCAFVLITLLITIALLCINFDGFLLRMTSLIFPLA
jgi:hypothetical protein